MKRSFMFVTIVLAIIDGCSPVPPDFAKKQDIRYKGTDVTSISSERVNTNVVFQETNRDSASLDNVSVDYEFFLEGQKVASGQHLKFNFKANDTTDFVVPVSVRYLDFFKTAENLSKAIINGKKTVKFQIRTVVTIYFQLASFEIPVTAEGELPLPEIKKPNIKLKL